MSARAWLWIACIAAICSLAACGDDDDMGTPVNRDAGGDSGMDAGQDSGPPGPDSSLPDAAKDAEIVDGSIDASDDAGPDATTSDAAVIEPEPPPDDWTCPPGLWRDGWCDCGCSANDVDCSGNDCIEPGCLIGSSCQACFTVEGSWQSCVPEPDPAGWLYCEESWRGDGIPICDCGCGAPDPDCMGQGCWEPGCLKPSCQTRNGCNEAGLDPPDDCTQIGERQAGWRCPLGSYGSGDGCDCGCGIADPDCAGSGCSESQCYENSCHRCNDGAGRPYSCAAADADWDNGSVCSSVRFDADDGCDCGCGGPDPDCGTSEGCSERGCDDDGCDRCIDDLGRPTGCNVPSAWDASLCPLENYGTGDGCDCGCGADDPDCNGQGSSDQDFREACDVCHNPASPHLYGYDNCPGWTCGEETDDALATPDCDCGCGVIDPACRDTQKASCKEPGCSVASCDYCSDEQGVRTACGPTWGASGITCDIEYYDLDGLCDCGCGADDPDCGNLGCSTQGCMAPGCDVCHNGTTVETCDIWHCDTSEFNGGDGVCDCGCGADDPDCAGGGCKDPGCNDPWTDYDPSEQECDACHDPHGRVVECP
jgi:hypothetical protein